MVFSARLLALVTAFSIAIITGVCLYLIGGVEIYAIIIGFLAAFFTSFLLFFVMLEIYLFREVSKLVRIIERLKKKQIEEATQLKTGRLSPLKELREEIISFATAQQQEIDELKKLEAFRKEFVADVSHELKTPIFAAQGFVHTLLDGAMNDKVVRVKFLKKAAKSLDGLDVLVQDLLTLSHIETGQIRMEFERFDIYALAQEVIEQLENKIVKKEVQLSIDSDEASVWVYADRQRIGQVLTNLISNAVNHSFEGGEVIVKLEQRKKSVRVSVMDSGEGIPKEHIRRIFERFYRVDKSRSREKGGTGLGLAIVKHILDGHGTRAAVESTPGKGATFSFKLRKKEE